MKSTHWFWGKNLDFWVLGFIMLIWALIVFGLAFV